MAYLDLHHNNMFAAATVVPAAVSPSPDSVDGSGFSALEWSVIALAKRDGLRTLGTPSRTSRAFGSLFGFAEKSQLAEPRLEALRRVAVYAWRRGYALPKAEIGRFVEAGFTLAQVETLVASVTGYHIGQPDRKAVA